MTAKTDTWGIETDILVEDGLVGWIDEFLRDRLSQGLAPGSLRFYSQKLMLFVNFCKAHEIRYVRQINALFIRQYMLHLEEMHHNPGGRHAAFRSLRAFLNWYEIELDPDDWRNPIRKVKAPRVPIEPLDPVQIEDVFKMAAICHPEMFSGCRDKAILLCLLDTGARANELLNMNLEDIDQMRGSVLIRQGKGRKPRTVYLGKKARSALRKYLRLRKDIEQGVWVTTPRFSSGRLSYDGLREVIKRRAAEARVKKPTLHAFRRAFALTMLRNGTDVYTLAKLMGHEGIAVLQRYLKQNCQDTEAAFKNAGPVDHYDDYAMREVCMT